MTEGWAPQDPVDTRPPLREPDRIRYDRITLPTTAELQQPQYHEFVREGLRALVSGRTVARPDADSLEELVEAVNAVWQSYDRRQKECPAILLWQREPGQPVYANRAPEQTPGLFGGGPNALTVSPGAFIELAARTLAAGLRPRMIAVANEGWGVNPDLPQDRLDEIERAHAAGRLRLGNLPPRERTEMWSVYAQRTDPTEDLMRMWHIRKTHKPGRRKLEPIEAEAELKCRFAPLLAGTTSTHALEG
jgi:hypothetical protein